MNYDKGKKQEISQDTKKAEFRHQKRKYLIYIQSLTIICMKHHIVCFSYRPAYIQIERTVP